jgi:CheY-like chemotaxis protein
LGMHPRILVAEDNLFSRVVIGEMLSRIGFDHKIVDNGRDALEAFRSEIFDIVLLDLHMPLMDGFEAARRMRESKPARIIAVTADTAVTINSRARTGGALFDAVLTKPILQRDLVMVLGAGPTATDESMTSRDCEVLDHAYGLRAAGGVWTQFLVLARLFLKHTPDLVSLLESSVRLESYEDAALHAHSLQGSAASIGALKLSSAAGKLTHAARSRDGWPEVAALRDTVDSQWMELKGVLEEVLGTA